jgi:flagellar hook-associated protein 1 FlgK
LLDRRDQLIKELNQYVQTTSVKADDGSVGLYIGGSQELVLGNNASKVAIVNDDYGDSRTSKLAVMRSGTPSVIDENMLGGGEVPGLLRFQNSDLNEGRNLLGRLTLATTTAMNDQHKLGLDLDGNPGGDLFSPTVFGTSNVMIPKAPAILNTGGATLTLSIADTTKFAASDYEIQFTSGTTGNITRRSDGSITAFNAVPISIDGLDIAVTAGAAAGGDRFLIKPFTSSASNVTSMFSTPRALAVANPVVPYMGPTNTGSLQLVSLNASGQPAGLTLPPSPVPPATTGAGVQLTYSSGPPAGFLITGSAAIPSVNGIPVTQDPITGLQTIPYTPGVTPVAYTPNSLISLDGWQIKLTGAPSSNDSITIGNAKDPQYNKSYFQNAGNAAALMDLRDVAMFDGAAMTDGYAGLISQIGIRTQSADYAARVSATIATNVERDRAGVSGVNLDEEAASLLQYQQAYQASAKMIQIAQNIFDTLIQNLSR